MTNAHYPPYPAYKPSGADWLGDIPAHWEVRRLKFLASVIFSNVDKHSKEEELPIRLCNYVDVYKNEHIVSSLDFMEATAGINEIRKFTLEKGDIIITKDSEEWQDIAVPALVSEELDNVICGYHLALIRPFPNIVGNGYLFRSFQAAAINYQFQVAASGITRYGLGKQALGNSLFLVPPLAEQRAIADYLDRETAQIDALIAKKRELLDLLERQRTALISHAVTKGLNPAAPLKPSGVDWLGEIPAHWEIRRLKFLASVVYSNVDKNSKEEELLVWLCNYVDVYKNERITRNLDFMEATAGINEIKKFALNKGDVIITKDSEDWHDIAVPALVSEKLDNVICGYHLALVRSIPNIVDSGYLFRSFQAAALNYQFQVAASGITRYGLGKQALGDAVFLVPPLAEQRAIAEYLDRETAQIDRLKGEVEASIDLLQRYRTALISAAVTGKIDVRVPAAASCPSA